MAKNIFTLTNFGGFCTVLHESHQSYFILATYKNLHFSAKLDLLWAERDATREFNSKIAKKVFALTDFGYFCTVLHAIHQSYFFLAFYESLHFAAKLEKFWVAFDATRCLKATMAKNVLTLTKFCDFCTVLHDSTKLSSFWPPTRFCTFRRNLISLVGNGCN